MKDGSAEAITKAEEAQNNRAEMLAEREQLRSKFYALNIDTVAVKYFFKLLRKVSGTEDNFMQSIALMVEMIISEYEKDEEQPMKQLMCCRGLLMLTLNDSLAVDIGQEIATRILNTFNKLMS